MERDLPQDEEGVVLIINSSFWCFCFTIYDSGICCWGNSVKLTGPRPIIIGIEQNLYVVCIICSLRCATIIGKLSFHTQSCCSHWIQFQLIEDCLRFFFLCLDWTSTLHILLVWADSLSPFKKVMRENGTSFFMCKKI